ncbi:hypothetical protein ASF77_21790 [Massilia sp. Leaf139]|nr:hypothetical protein ASF77_21790 [Massilia sp. Leaf139]
MFLTGADEHELAQCLKKKKLHLLKAGARADNLPERPEEQARFISTLREEPMACIRDWFYANANFEDLPDVQDACRILADEAEAAALDRGGRRLHWRSVLAAFVQQRNSHAVDAFLQHSSVARSPVLPQAMKDEGIIVVKPSHAREPAKSSAPDSAAAGKIAGAIPSMRPGSLASALPLRLSEVLLNDKSVLTVLGRRTTVLPTGQFFIKISGILLDGTPVYLTPDESELVFPDSGDATGFPNTVHVGSSSAESLSVWQVEHKSPDKKVQYVVTDFMSHTYEVFDIPHPSSEPDLVRDWIKEVYKPAHDVFPVFRLQDGPIVKLPAEVTDPRTANFDAALPLYREHPTVKWSGRTIVIEPFPASRLQYDCAPIRTAVRKLFRESAELSGLPVLTKRQISELADAAARHSTDATIKQSVQRAKARLEQLFDNKEELRSLMEEIVLLPSVAEAIGAEKTRAAAAVREEAESSRAELGKLAAEKKQLQSEIENLKQARKKESAAAAREIKQAFERAGADGLKTLAELSVFKNILGLSAAHPAGTAPAAQPAEREAAQGAALEQPALPKHIHIASAEQLRPVLASWQLHNGLSTRMLQALIAAAATQGVAILAGTRRHEAAAALASTLAAGTSCAVSVSADMFNTSDLMNAPATVTDAHGSRAGQLGAFIARQQAAGMVSIVRIRGANRAPPESLIPELLEIAGTPVGGSAITWARKDGSLQLITAECPVVFLLELAHGRSVFPLMPPLAWEIPIIDTDAPWADYHEPEFEIPSPCAAIAPELFAAFSPPGPVPLPSARGIPRNAIEAARKMKGACMAAGLGASESALVPLVALAHCRADSGTLAAMIDAAGGELAPAFKAYAAEAAFTQTFDMGAV